MENAVHSAAVPTAAPPAAGSGGAARARVSAELALVLVTAIWGATFPVVKSAIGHASPVLFNAVRMSAAALCLALVHRHALRGMPRSTWLAAAWLGLCLAGGYVLQTLGLAYTTPAKSAFITGLSVVIVPLMLALGWKRRVTARIWIAALLAVVGLYGLVAGGGRATGAAMRGEWLTLACAGCFAAQIVVLGEAAIRHRVAALATLQILFCALFSWAALPWVETPRWQSTPGLYMALAVTAVFATAVAFSVQAWAQQFTPASRAAVILSLEPVFGCLASYVGWHERLRPLQLLGAALIMSAIAAVEWRKPAR